MIHYLIFDSETTGLHIITDRAFMFQYGLVDDKLNLISKHVIRSDDQQAMSTFINYVETVPVLVGHNIKFDIHM
jgi:DNA polymerase III alpha subunit (gram-positive type)